MKYNNELKVIDTQEKAYLLGFLYGDGTISTYKCKDENSYSFYTRISINKDDEELIYQLHKEFSFFNIGEFDYSIYGGKTGWQKSISKTGKLLYDDLLLNGLYPRKSYENKEKLKLPNICNDLMSHFIRGFFDADGSVYTRAKRKNLITIEFSSVSKSFITELNSYLKSIDINCWKIVEVTSLKDNRQIYYKLVFIKTDEILKLIDFMYRDANIKLKRKATKCLVYKPVNKVIDRNIICPECGNDKVWINGYRGNSTRYKCQECKIGFSIKNILN